MGIPGREERERSSHSGHLSGRIKAEAEDPVALSAKGPVVPMGQKKWGLTSCVRGNIEECFRAHVKNGRRVRWHVLGTAHCKDWQWLSLDTSPNFGPSGPCWFTKSLSLHLNFSICTLLLGPPQVYEGLLFWLCSLENHAILGKCYFI